MLIPYDVDVIQRHRRYANYGLIVACSVVFLLIQFDVGSEEFWDSLVLQDYNPIQLVGSMFLHLGFFHLLFNMIYLWVFGNAVCSTIGGWKYLSVYLIGGVLAGLLHLLIDGTPAVGASGAINAVIGFYLALYPSNQINCFWFFIIRGGKFGISGYWLILFWFLWDAWDAISGSTGGVASWAHVGGFISGLAMGLLFLQRGWATLDEIDHPSLLDYLTRRKRPAEPSPDRPHYQNQKLDQSSTNSVATPALASMAPRVYELGRGTCPHCYAYLAVEAGMAGKRVSCSSCHKPLIIARPKDPESK